ncbi:MAG TPA: ABC transporter substrate-binding protein [Stellaceae bacterium]|nr:ABC transporter substrate-binding protein [Stellaceae bacterium]
MIKRWALALVGLGFLASAAHATPETVSVELVKSIGQAPFYVAVGKGYFDQAGIKIDSGDVRSALDAVASLATGRLDVAIGAATAGFFNAAHRGFDLRVVAAMGIQGPLMATQPLVRKALWENGTIRSAKDLKGRKVAINAPGDITEYFLTLMLEKYGMELKDVNLTPLGFAEQFVAFKNGAIDAGFLPEPLSTAAQMAGTVELLKPEAGIGAGTITTFVFYSEKFMHERPKVALDFLRALVRAARETQGNYNQNPELAAMIAKQTGLKVEAVERCTPFAIDPNLDITKYEPGLRREESVMRKNGRLNYDKPLSFKNVIDATLVHEAAASVK